MKTKLVLAPDRQPRTRKLFKVGLLMVGMLLAAGLRALAQDAIVRVSAEEFQRLVYAGQVLAQMEDKPELDASLFVLLEWQRRNPQADPAVLITLSRQALARYRTNAPACVRNGAWRDEVLVAYLDAWRQLPGHTNLNSATLALIAPLIAHLSAPAGMPQTELLNSGFLRLLNTQEEGLQRQALADLSADRSAHNAAFRAALDGLLVPEIGVSVTNTPAEIINSTAALSNNPTLRVLLQISLTNPTHGVQVPLAQLKSLFTSEMGLLHDTVTTNMAVDLEISGRQADLPAYLANQQALSADVQREEAVYQLQAQKIAASHASFNVVSSLASYKDGKLGKDFSTVGAALSSVAKGIGQLKQAGGLNKLNGIASFVSAGLGIFSLFDSGPPPDQIILQGIDDLKGMIRDFSAHVDYRFDRVDQSLTEIYTNLNAHLDQIDLQLGQVQADVTQIRRDLLVTQNDLHRLEREMFEFLNAGFRRELVAVINGALGYERTYGGPMNYATFTQIPDGPENTFYTWAFSNAKDPLSSPAGFAAADLTDSMLLTKLSTLPLEASLNYLNQFLSTRFGLPSLGPTPMANPRDWFVGAQAYLQLALENPLHFRRVAVTRLNNIISNGQELQDYCQNLLFTGSGATLRLHTNLHNALLGHYETKLSALTNQVRADEQQYAKAHYIPALDTWRQWGIAAPRVTTPGTRLLESHRPQPVVRLGSLPAGAAAPSGTVALGGDLSSSFGLARQADGTVTVWSDTITVPTDLSNVVSVAAGATHNLALRADGTVAAWGDSLYGLDTRPPLATNVVAIGTGRDHNLAVRADGKVVGWGYNYYGQATGVPTPSSPYCSTGLVAVAGQTITNAIAAGGGFYYSLVLKADGKVVAWSTSGYGETNVPPGLAGVKAIAPGGFHSLALLSNSTVVAWGDNGAGQTNVPPGLTNVLAIAAGSHHSLALRSNGTVVAWGWSGYGQTNVPPGLSNVVAIAADQCNSLALRNDGTMVVWGYNSWLWEGPVPVPAGLSNLVAVAAGDSHVTALKSDGTVITWASLAATSGQANVPPGLTNVVAVAAGQNHSLALRTDGAVVAWGNNSSGQTNVPGDVTNIVAIAANDDQSVALRANGTVRVWGNAYAPPATLSNVVAIAAGQYFNLALKGDGTVFGWGDDYYAQSTGVRPSDPPYLGSDYVTVSGQRLSNVVAIAAGWKHSLALKADGTVVCWGTGSGSGENIVPAALSNVVAIAAGLFHSLALKSDGSVAAWGYNADSQSTVPPEATNVVAIAAGYHLSLFLQSLGQPSGDSARDLQFLRSSIPVLVRKNLWGLNALLLTNLDLDLQAPAAELSGSRALLEAVLSLAIPYTLERDDVLHSFLYGQEPLVNLDSSRQMLLDEMNRLQTPPFVPAMSLNQVAAARLGCFETRLHARLNELAQSGQGEPPRLLGHTLRLLNLLRDSYAPLPAPTLELSRETNALQLVLYGEPYAHHSLQYQDSLNAMPWAATAITNLHNAELITPPRSTGASRFYRAVLPPAP